jgi:hypothetical protein
MTKKRNMDEYGLAVPPVSTKSLVVPAEESLPSPVILTYPNYKSKVDSNLMIQWNMLNMS